MFTKNLSKPAFLAALLALSLSHIQPAHAEGFVSKLKGAFVATGDAIKDTAKATGDVIKVGARATGDVVVGSAKLTGNVLKDSAKVTGDVLIGTAKAGEAAYTATGDVLKSSAKATGVACSATGKAVGTTAGAVAGATGEVISGSAKAVGNTTGAVVGATEGVLGMHRKGNVPTAITASNATPHQNIRYSHYSPEARAASPLAAPAQVPAPESAALSTEGTRILPPVEETNESPSWNVQEPVASSTAFAAQYALRTTPLQATSH